MSCPVPVVFSEAKEFEMHKHHNYCFHETSRNKGWHPLRQWRKNEKGLWGARSRERAGLAELLWVLNIPRHVCVSPQKEVDSAPAVHRIIRPQVFWFLGSVSIELPLDWCKPCTHLPALPGRCNCVSSYFVCPVPAVTVVTCAWFITCIIFILFT